MAVLQVVAVPFPPFLTPPGHPGRGGGRYELPTSIEARRHNLSPGGLAGICKEGWLGSEEGWLGSEEGWLGSEEGWLGSEEGWLGSEGGLAGI